MCAVSYIGDDFNKRAPIQWPWIVPQPSDTLQDYNKFTIPQSATKEEVESLRKELEALKKLLKAAKIYDEETGQPECQMEQKIELIKKLCELLEVDISDLKL